ncbi:MAG: VOC family protein [Thermoleophilia bacterium]
MIKNAFAYPTLPASDLARARTFYEQTLELEPVEGADDPDGVYYQLGTQILFLYQTEAPRGGNTALSFVVDDLDAEMKDLRSRGVSFEDYDMPGLKTENGVAEFDGMKAAWFKDTEGNILNIGQPTEEQLRMLRDRLK